MQWLIDVSFLVFSVGLAGVATRYFPLTLGVGSEKFFSLNRWFIRTSAIGIILISCFASIAVLEFTRLHDLRLIAVVILYAIANSTYALFSARAQGLFQYKRFAVSSMIVVLAILAGLTLLRGSDGLFDVLLVMGVAYLIAGFFLVIYVPRKDSSLHTVPIEKVQEEQIYHYAKNVWVTSIVASLVWSRGELPLVKGYLSETAVGYYSIGLTITGIINQGVGLLTGALWPQIAQAWDKGNRKELMRFSCVVTNLLMLVAGVAAGFVICFAPYIVKLLFSEKYLPGADLVLIFALGALGLTCNCANAVVQIATDGKFGRNITIAGSVVLYTTAFIFISRFGIEGAALARTLTQIGVAFMTLIWIGKIFGKNKDYRQNMKSFALLILLTGSLTVLLRFAGRELNSWGLCALYGFYCYLVWLICLPGWNGGMLHELRKLSKIENLKE